MTTPILDILNTHSLIDEKKSLVCLDGMFHMEYKTISRRSEYCG